MRYVEHIYIYNNEEHYIYWGYIYIYIWDIYVEHIMLHAALHSKPFSNLKIRYIYYYCCCKSIYIPDLCCWLYLALELLNRYNGYVFMVSTLLDCLKDKCCSRYEVIAGVPNKKD